MSSSRTRATAAWLLGALALAPSCSGELGTGGGDGPDRFADLGGGELGPDHLRCRGTDDDCGAFVCTDCSVSSLGHRCVLRKCACAGPADCDPGRACVDGTCQLTGCSDEVPCRGGCCDRGTCVAGTSGAACGGDGRSCQPCSGATPTCIGGACSADCVAGRPGDEGVCSPGFCCGAGNRCQPIGNAACAPEGGLCADCAVAPTGPICGKDGRCGCESAADCPIGQACRAGLCGAACDGSAPCNGGCCADGACVSGVTRSACATGPTACTDCKGDPAGGACMAAPGGAPGRCGCGSSRDCPVGQACDPATRACGVKCDANRLCNGGCCRAGTCDPGKGNAACGEGGGDCVDCARSPLGSTCVPQAEGGHCGCLVNLHCVGLSCDANFQVCSRPCSMNLPCPAGGGCCSAAQNGTCLPGGAGPKCGASGLCVDCGASPAGRACRGGKQCGCDSAADCPVGQACDPATRRCGAACGLNQPCNGGCCAAGQCAAGNGASSCGDGGDACLDCSRSPAGRACVGGRCGCAAAADCPALSSCDPGTRRCTTACDLDRPCQGGCCLGGTCVPGSANSACGATGRTCVACAGGTPTCEGGACTARCGAPGSGQCSGGTCCRGGQCVTGNTAMACGSSGSCQDCGASADGTRCVVPPGGPAHCGCADRLDCPAAVTARNLPGRACDTSPGVNKCTSACGAPGISACNGGCCTGAAGQCSGGGQQEACGLSGGFCSDCLLSCSPGPVCNPMTGSCGCSRINDCFYEIQCQTVVQREACSVPRGVCCVPAWFNGHAYRDNGSPMNCCTGMSQNGFCTCVPTGQASGGDPSRCCSQRQNAGTCVCLGNGAVCLLERDSNGECCSGQCKETARNVYTCVPSTRGQPCQTDAGCANGLRCNNQVCG